MLTETVQARVAATMRLHEESPYGGCECGWLVRTSNAVEQRNAYIEHVAEQVAHDLAKWGMS